MGSTEEDRDELDDRLVIVLRKEAWPLIMCPSCGYSYLEINKRRGWRLPLKVAPVGYSVVSYFVALLAGSHMLFVRAAACGSPSLFAAGLLAATWIVLMALLAGFDVLLGVPPVLTGPGSVRHSYFCGSLTSLHVLLMVPPREVCSGIFILRIGFWD